MQVNSAFFCLILLFCSCSNEKVDEVVANVDSVAWYETTAGLPRKLTHNYYKQKVYISYDYEGVAYNGVFIAGKSIGVMKEGFKVEIEIGENPVNFKVTKVLPNIREKFDPVVGTAK